MFAPLTHQHVFWWGVEFLLPASPDDSQPTSDGENNAPLWIGTSPIAQRTVGLATSPLALIATFELATIQVVVVAPRQALGSPRPECNLLCDTARHERSGVQLA
jgi:hypothetical protein